MKTSFKVQLVDVTYTSEFYNARGERIYDIKEAVKVAERDYGDDCKHVFNGDESINREEK